MLDVAVDAMAAEQAEHEQVRARARARARMPLLPPVLRGVGKRLGNHVNQGFGGRCRPGAPALQGFGGRYRHGAPVVAGVDGSDAYRAEAEPFTAKRSGTG